MKFFPGIGSCFPVTPVTEEASTEPNNETADGDDHYYRKQKCNGSGAAPATTHWRPSLKVISENGGRPFVTESGRKTRNVDAHAGDKRTSSSTEGKPGAKHRSSCNGHKRDDSYHRSDPMEMPIPVYSATPFTF